MGFFLKNKGIARTRGLLLRFHLIMPKQKMRLKDQRGFTLMEMVVGLMLSGIIFLIIFALLGQTAKFAAFFNSTATSIEGVSDAVSQLNAVMPQIVKVRSCGCRGGPNTNLSNCRWQDSDPWRNPVLNDGVSNTANGGVGHMLLDADFESFFGSTAADTSQLLRPTGFATNLGGCISYASVPAGQMRGCKQQVRLFYRAPEVEVGTTPSRSGMLTMLIGTANPTLPADISGTAAPAGQIMIGRPLQDGAEGLGLTELSCGFSTVDIGGVATSAGLLFVLNFKIKARGTMLQNVSHAQYESWYPTVNATNGYSGSSGKNYELGLFRDVRLKFALRNIGTRGLHHWRASSVRGCSPDGTTGVNLQTQCCSMALAGTTCVACSPAGSTTNATTTGCCSGKVSGGACL